MRTILINLLFTSLFLLTSCSLYRVDVRQGNELDDEQVTKLKVGMNKKQVTFLMGNPLLTDPFHKDRWDYIHTFRKGYHKTKRSLLTLYFDGNKLVRIDDSQLAEKALKD